MANTTGWDDVSGKTAKKGTGTYKEYPRLTFAKVEYDKPFTFRPLDKPVGFWLYMRQHEDGSWRRAICADPETCSTARKHNIAPAEKYAMAVINRANQHAELLEFTPGVKNEFVKSKDDLKVEPGSSTDGSDFKLTKTKKTMKNGESRTSYELRRLERTPLTPEEREKIIVPLLDFFKDQRLTFIYKATPDDKIEEILFGKREGNASPAAAKQATPPAQKEAPKAEEVSGDSIPF
jgi:hypothetical protein